MTILRDRWQLETYVLPRWGKRGIREISKREVKRFLEDLAAGTRRRLSSRRR